MNKELNQEQLNKVSGGVETGDSRLNRVIEIFQMNATVTVDQNSLLADIGIDQLDIADICETIEAEFSIKINPDNVSFQMTVFSFYQTYFFSTARSR